MNLFYRGMYKELAVRYGKEKADELWRASEEELNQLVRENAAADKQSKSYVYPAVAIYRTLYAFDPEHALEACRAYGTILGRKLGRMVHGLTSIPGMPELIWKNVDSIMTRMSAGYDTKNVTHEGNQATMDITMCPLFEAANNVGTPEAAQLICCMDKAYMTGFRHIDYVRTMSVAEGDEVCDYRLGYNKNKK